MSLALLNSRAPSGMHAPEVMVEVHLANGLPAFNIVGLPDTEVKESKDRVRAAILNSNFEFPNRRITVNLAPADLPKESGRFDLPIALGILAASEQIPSTSLGEFEYAGELSLSGALRPVRGALAMAYAVTRQPGKTRGFILPRGSAAEAALVEGAMVYPAATLLEVCAHLSQRTLLTPLRNAPPAQAPVYPDLCEVKGQTQAKRALEIAASGRHSLLLIGPPGTGKSMLAARFAGLLPPMSDEEALESAALLSLVGMFAIERWRTRMVRAPHHTASGVALVGGGSTPRPGEISLAHHGVLFLDELPEFDRRVLEVLREPMESGHITISRAGRQADFPARFQLIAAMNPCPCGYLGHRSGKCRCTPEQVKRYRDRISGPLLDRIDLRIEVPTPPPEVLASRVTSETSSAVRSRVEVAHQRQMRRQGHSNALLAGAELEAFCALASDASDLLNKAIQRLNLSARAYHRVLRVARSIADLADSNNITSTHLAEALQYRGSDSAM